MKYLYIVLLTLCLAGCASTKKALTSTSQDQAYISADRLDSLFRASLQRDSVFIRDSIYVREKGDTILQYVEKVRYQYKTRTDTIYRNISLRDTVYLERTDSVTIEKPRYIEKPIAWYNQGFIWLGKVFVAAFIIILLYFTIKRKF